MLFFEIVIDNNDDKEGAHDWDKFLFGKWDSGNLNKSWKINSTDGEK